MARLRTDARRALDVATSAETAAIRRLRAGGRLREPIQATDDVLAAAGLTGRRTCPNVRGLGLRIDERPKAADARDLDLPHAPSMCTCVQRLHIPQSGRIVGRSDSVLITKEGLAVISELPREL